MVNMADIVNDIYYRLDDNANDDTDFGDDDNTAAVIPTAVVDFTGDISYYTLPVTHEQRAKITWSWSEPIMYDEDSNPIDVYDPEVQDDFDFDPVVAYMFRTSETAYVRITSLNIITQDHKLERDVTGYVYPITKSGLTGPVATFIAHVTKDTTPPPTPATPILTSEMGTVTATYNGKDNTGVDMPPDVNLLHVYGGTINPPTAEVGSLLGPGQLPIEATVGLNYYVRFRAEDHAGNFSPYSATASIVVKSVLDDTGLEEALANRSRVIQSNTMPPGSSYQINDVWFDTDDGNKIYFWKGLPTGWQPQGLNTNTITDDAITADKLANSINSEIASKASVDYIISRGTDLVANGTGLLGTNYNFPNTTFDSADTPIGRGSFRSNNASNTTIISTELIPVDPSKSYILQVYAKQKSSSNTAIAYSGLAPYDVDQLNIQPYHYMFQNNTTTTLANTVVPGATTINLANAANWNNSAGSSSWLRSLIAWNYVDGQGKTWPVETYSRMRYSDLWADGGISGNQITLKVPWAGPTLPAGTPVSNGSSAGSYMYGGLNATVVPKVWTSYTSAIYTGEHTNKQAGATTAFPPGTAYVKLVFLPNFSDTANSQHAFAGISFSDSTAAQVTANTALTTANGKNKVTFSASAPTAASPGVPGDIWWVRSGNTITAQYLCTAGTGVAYGNTWVTQTLTNTTIANLDAGKITTGSLSADRIDANTITVDKLVIGDMSNIALDPVVDANIGVNWTGTNVAVTAVTGAVSSLRALVNNATGNWKVESVGFFPVDVGAWYAVGGEVYRNASGAINVGIQFYNDAKTAIGSVVNGVVNFNVNITWTVVVGSVQAPANAAYGKLVATSNGLTGVNHAYITGFILRRMASGELIVDGAVVANKLATNSVVAGKIATDAIEARHLSANSIDVGTDVIANGAIVGNHVAALTITGAKIAANTITGDKILANQIVASHITTGAITSDKILAGAIDGKVITGAIIQTIVTANRGIILDTNSLRAYNSSGVATLTIDASTGAISMLGSLTSGSTITGATITGGVINGTIINSEDGLVVDNSGSIRLNNSSGYVRITGLYVSGSGNVLSVSANGGISVGSGSNAWVSATGGFYSGSGNITTGSGDIGTTSGIVFSSSTIYPSNFGRLVVGMATTTGSSNIYSASNGSQLQRISSLRKYKKLISDNITDDFLMMKPKTWYDKSQIEEAGLDSETVTEKECIKAGLRRIAGFIAEEIEEVNPLYATYYESDLTGVAYDRLTVAIHKTLTNMNKRLLALESVK